MPSGIYIRTIEGRRHMSEAHKGKPNSHKGSPQTEEHKRKISEALKGEKNPAKRLEVKKKISEMQKGKPHFHKGVPCSEKTRQKIGEANRGSKSYNWKGGISYDPYPIDWVDVLREAIRQRDDYVCQICGIHQDELKGWNKKLDIHHIDYDKDNLNPDNLISLCRSCHTKTNYGREYWTKYFQKWVIEDRK